MLKHCLRVVTLAALTIACGPSDVPPGEVDAAATPIDAASPAPDAPAPDAAAGTPDAAADAAPVDAAPIDAVPCSPDPDGEKCNGIDDDCDEEVDEGFPGVGVDCDVGVGACERNGATVCTADGLGVECSAIPGAPTTELCGSGVDEDCDNFVDEGFPDLGMGCTGGVGACAAAGTWVCSADELSVVCDAVPGAPATERCGSGVDEDCDGSVDEGFPTVGTVCAAGVGACERPGAVVCTADGLGTTCNAVPGGSSPELCNGIDDDCDGAVDDGNPGGGSSCVTGLPGVCSAGTQQCLAGSVSCQPNSAGGSESCNGLDDDCDGAVDDGLGLGAACDGTDGDLCAEGVVACNGAGGTTCNDTTPTNGELCNGLDDDCDGAIDEGYTLGAACDGGDADSCPDGTTVCNAAGTGTECNDGPGAATESCNGVDDDCDGSVDEGYALGAACDGADGDSCAEGVTVCNAAGTGTTCNDATGTITESCNGADDDCDGAVDEGYALGAACDGGDADACAEGVTVCNAGGTGTTCNDATGDAVETCNAVDDDCDGTTDEGFGLGAACDGGDGDLCAEGVVVCNGAGGTTCNDASATNSELCNGADDDCDGSVDEGYALGVSCDGGDADLCNEGVTVCNGSGSGTTCNDLTAANAELCNGADDDCDGAVDEGFTLGAACDGSDGDLCNEGVTICNAAGTGTTCNDGTATNAELCDAEDNDCDGTNNEGFSLGVACDGSDGDACAEGVTVCNAAGTGTTCNDATGTTTELCDSTDNDCDGTNNEGFVLGGACDGGDGDLCAEGTVVCDGAGTGTTCSDSTGTNPELCDSVDNDCDGTNNEGYVLGGACDGGDGDLCAEGTVVCDGAGTGTTCNDATGTNPELCDSVDNDCDGTNNEGFVLGGACDGADGDACAEGTVVCDGAGTGTTCNDLTGTIAELCDSIDNDCDGTNNEGFTLGVACDGSDGDACAEGVTVCDGAGTGTTCNDTTGTLTESCNAADDDCDGQVDEDWNRDDNPACSSGTYYLGSVSGDSSGGVLTDAWYDEEWDRATITEDSSSSVYLSATISLTSAPGTDFDLYVYCVSCGGTLVGSSALGGLTGHTDTVYFRSDDDFGVTDSQDIIIEVRHWASTACANWSLTVDGDTSVSTETCP